MKTWFVFKNVADDGSVADIHIIDFIGDWIDDYISRNYGYDGGVTAKAFVEQLAALPATVKSIRVHINSPGGDVFAAVNIANALRAQQVEKGRAIETICEGLAASAASIILMAGSKVTIADNAMVMIHNPWSFAIGNAGDMRKAAETLDAIRNSIIATYKWHSSLGEDELRALMDAETWMDATEALEKGFATDKVDGLQAAASLDPKAAAKLKIPDRFKARVDALLNKPAPAPTPESPSAVIRACNDAGCSELAAELVDAKATPEQVKAKVQAAKTAKEGAQARATTIRRLCAESKAPALADSLVTSALSVEQVKAHLVTVTALKSDVVIDTAHHPDQGAGARAAAIDTAAVYAELNKKRG